MTTPQIPEDWPEHDPASQQAEGANDRDLNLPDVPPDPLDTQPDSAGEAGEHGGER
jgi:hypothetical protein